MSAKRLDNLLAAIALLSVLPLMLAGQAMRLGCFGAYCQDCESWRGLGNPPIPFAGVSRAAELRRNSPPNAALGRGVDTMDTSVSGFNFPTVAPGDNGVIHRHLDFSLPGSAPAGAYGLVFELASADYASSEEFLVVFNNDLNGPQFEAGVDAISQAAFTAVPEPDAVMLWAAGASILLVGLWWRRVRRVGTAHHFDAHE